MTIKDYCLLAKNRLLKNKISSLYNIMIIAFSFVLAVVTTSVVLGLIKQANLENILFSFYLSLKGNRAETLAVFVFISMLVFASIVVLGHIIRATYSRKQEFKNKMMLGASYLNLSLESLLENMIIYIIGAVVGALLSYLVILIVGAIINVTISFSLYTFVILLVIEFAIVLFGSITPIFWVTTSEEN